MSDPVVLNVEDDDASYFILNQLFEEICPEIRLLRAHDGAEALSTIQSLATDPGVELQLVLLDVFLPMVGGWEVLESIRAVESLRQLPVVMFTSLVLERDRARCRALDVEYLEKPAELSALVALVKEICGRVRPSSLSQ